MSSFVTLDNLDDFLPSNDLPFLFPIALQKHTFGALSLSYSYVSHRLEKRRGGQSHNSINLLI